MKKILLISLAISIITGPLITWGLIENRDIRGYDIGGGCHSVNLDDTNGLKVLHIPTDSQICVGTNRPPQTAFDYINQGNVIISIIAGIVSYPFVVIILSGLLYRLRHPVETKTRKTNHSPKLKKK